jgi:peptidyl-prolyl cis-trans isomerase SDCCAG10
LGTANTGKNDNNSQFFITLDKAEDLNKKHTLFGKITGNTVFNILSICDVCLLPFRFSLDH